MISAVPRAADSARDKPMPAKQHEEMPKEQKNQERQQVNAAIGRHVMNALGQPGDLHRVHVRQLWEDRYRVNILVGTDASSVKIAHSYFLVTDGSGNIVASEPKIKKEY